MANPYPSHRTEDITSYMTSIENIELITPEREKELAEQIHGDDPCLRELATEELVCANLRLVVKIAHDFKRYGLTFDDLVAEGNVGLIIAAGKFDPSKGAKFSCYAAWWIKQSMRKAIAQQTRTIRIPGQAAQKMLHVEKARNKFENAHQRLPSDEEVADMTGYAQRFIESLNYVATTTYSLDETVKDGSETTFEEMIASKSDTTVKKAAEEEQLDNLRQLLFRLSDRERVLITYHFGLEGTILNERLIAQETGITTKEQQDVLSGIYDKLRASLTV